MLEDEWMLSAMDVTLDDKDINEVCTHLSGQMTAAEIFLAPFMGEDWRDLINEVEVLLVLLWVFTMMAEDGGWMCTE